ncbi:DNA-binding transcriptional regulator, MerR family [Glycomyces sambucus]|uniref:DNA-binding transcriptional regulator, MerR family n=1 Tax=Glycomyces sambucus TaxID=380244 RepID=A0A1G9FAL8_9ACTN|nr:TipAS antibiotic-recognition domain-containing protein [Glycomyces sambucus]SDK85434.1 DNA-binding transcriptional regulator, MerR family [Glycomyces sambucus]
MDTWTTAHVVKLTGVTARTLRHYDAIGLLAPAGAGHGGQRRYGRPELLRLQQILLLKRLGLRLDTIAQILEGGLDETQALRRHAAEIAAEQERLARLAATVADTIRQLEGGTPMAPETWFTGLDDRHREEARRRWGQAVVERAWAVVQDMTPEQRRAIPAEFDRVNAALDALRTAGHAPGDAPVQAVVADHHRLVARHWDSEPGREAYTGLAALYTDDPRFRETYDRVGAGFAAYLRAAMDAYAQERLP